MFFNYVFLFHTKQHLCPDSSGLASHIAKNVLFLELLHYPNQVLSLVMLLTLPVPFPGGCGACSSVCFGLDTTQQWRAEVDIVMSLYPSTCACCHPSPGGVRSNALAPQGSRPFFFLTHMAGLLLLVASDEVY